ncbi:MAG: polyketide cyclase [Candidatus Dactylopiibacterium carminicum]|nr:MAG: polyketide cyclase [Candidatus Dactylopiibacterium carminicum]
MYPNAELDLHLDRLLRASRTRLWQAWSDPAQLKEWWCPKPWVTEVRAFDFRPGGAFHTFMHGPDGGTSDNPGCFLEIVPFQRIVCTSTLLAGWRPAPNPWMPMTAIFTFADEEGGTRYRAHVMHATTEARLQHEQMGFHEGWGICIQQLDEHALTLA